MRVEVSEWSARQGWSVSRRDKGFAEPQLVLLFGARSALESGAVVPELRSRYPGAQLIGCSTAGEICDTTVREDGAVATAIQWEHTTLQVVSNELRDVEASAAMGAALARQLESQGLVHVFALAEGLQINGSELVRGLQAVLPPHVAVTGGLAGDGSKFEHTLLCVNGELRERAVTLVGLYGDRLKVGYGSLGGWDAFGPERLITRSEGNVLYELDGEPALDLYKRYLGDHAAELPASGLLFPLSLRNGDPAHRIVRTILSVDEAARSLTFAGDVPHGHHARLMRANVDRLIDGATGAATASYEALGAATPELAILISCVGRRLVLQQRVEEEVESVRDVLGAGAALCGFYSYGEIAPFLPSARCELHNQTMTITTLSER